MQSSLEGRIWVGKGAQATGMTASLRMQSSKADLNTWESFTRSELKLESVHQESPHSDIFRKMATKPHLKQKHCQKHVWRGTESMLLKVQCEVSTVCDDLGCHVICWCWSIVFLWGIVKRKMRDTRPNNADDQSNLGFHYTWAVPQADCLHATPHWCSNSCERRPNQVLSA